MNPIHPSISIETATEKQTNPMVIVLFWLYVGIPLAWGISSTAKKAMALFL